MNNCPHCNSDRTVRNGTTDRKRSKQKYLCRNCGKTWTGELVPVPQEEKIRPKCKYCGSDRTVRIGQQPNGNRRWKCNDCQKRWTESDRGKRRAKSRRRKDIE